MCNGGIALADLCTALLLGREFRISGRNAFFVLACAYLFSAVMALVHMSVFPGAVFETPLFGNPQTVVWAFLLWRLGTAALLFAAVLLARQPPLALPADGLARRLRAGWIVTLAGGAACTMLASHLDIPMIVGTRFTGTNLAVVWMYLLLCAAALALIWRGRAFDDSLYLWLTLVLAAALSEQVLGSLSGGQYTVGWHVAKASSVVSASMLLVFWLGHMTAEEQSTRLSRVAGYGAAIGVVLAAVLLRWFLTPWIGLRVPFATVLGAVAIAVWMAGWKPAALAAALGFAASMTLFREPTGEVELLRRADVLDSVIYWIASALIIGLGEAMRRAIRNARRLEAEVRQRAAELQRADANKSQFLALLSHELRNPLAPLVNGLALLRMPRDPRTAAETQAMMERQVGHLRRLIDDLLDVSRIDRGKLELRRERVAIDAVVRNAIETAKPNIEAKSHELVVRYAPEPLYVEGDPVRLGQVVANLVNNAAKFTPPRGRIEIATRAEPGEAVVSVKDSGIGFAPGDERVIFDMFVQLDASRTQAAGGLGLGLTLVRSLLEMHGGRIEARSAGAGRGAEFVFRLPLAPAPAQASSSLPPQRSLKTKRRVLVVDDNVDAADSLAAILSAEGFDAHASYDGAHALELAREFRPEVVFVDLNMPGMSGLELAAKLRAQPWGRAMRLVALTGMGQKGDLEATRAAGFHAHLTKPAFPEQVLALAANEDAGNVIPLHEGLICAPGMQRP